MSLAAPTGPGAAVPVRRRTALAARVVRTSELNRSFVRVVLGGDGLAGFVPSPFADSYVKLAFLGPGTAPALDAEGRLDLTAQQAHGPAPRLRAYTVRGWDPVAHELTLDVVVHGTAGLGGPWATGAAAGDRAWVVGPGGSYSPDPTADAHLLVGDESAVPAVCVAVEQLPAGARARVLLEVRAEQDQVPLGPPPGAEVDVTWVHRGDDVVGRRLVEATRAGVWPAGRVHVFVHGEAGWVAELRRHLRIERRVPLSDLSLSGYWRLGSDDEGWRAAKRTWAAELAAAEAGAAGPD
ncbi:MAG TPA: siderophore-interacting protein [Actinotalea sp.]|nr:siderophore-interacting protein [Actinotalea sp.]